MRAFSKSWCLILALGLATIALPVSAHNAIELGHHASGQLFPHWHQSTPSPLPISGFPGINGWADVEVGVEAVFKDDPDHDLFVLDDACSIQFVVVSADPGMHVFNENGSAHVPIGGTFTLGNPPFHFHPLWHLEEKFGVYGQTYSMQIKFIDTTGLYTDSEVIDIDFTPHCPGDVNLNAFVDVDDLLAIINSWGECPNFCQTTCPADLDQTCVVDVDDLLAVINAWGDCNE